MKDLEADPRLLASLASHAVHHGSVNQINPNRYQNIAAMQTKVRACVALVDMYTEAG